MRSRYLIPLAIAALLADATAQDDSRRRGRFNRRNRAPAELHHGEFTETTFRSKSLDQDMRYGIYVPNSYEQDGDERYPVVIWLHGMRNDYRRFHTGGGTGILDRLIGEEKLPPLILVTADAGNSFYINGVSSGKFEDLITVDLIQEVESKYRIAKDRHMRAIMGISMGGMGALKIALRKPELFGTVAAHSSAVLPVDPDDLPRQYQQMLWGRYGDQIFGNPLDARKWREENPMYLAGKASAESLKGLRIYFDVGSADRYQFQGTNAALHELMEEREIPHTWVLIDGGGHAWSSGFPMAALERSLLFVGETINGREGNRERENRDGNGMTGTHSRGKRARN
jgi:enterochelin esterase family protein